VKKTTFVSLVLLLAVVGFGGHVGASAQEATFDPTHAQADAYLTQARASRAAGALAQASDLITSALQIAPDYSEALYANAERELAERNKTLAAVADLQQALANGSWTVTDPSVAQENLAEVLLRIGRLQEARGLLLSLVSNGPSSWRPFLTLAMLYDREGDAAALRRALSDDLHEFPLVDDFTLLSSRQLDREGERQAARRLVETQLEVHPDNLPLLLRAAELAPGAAARVAAVDRYTKKGGKDPLAAVIALETAGGRLKKYYLQFVDDGGLSREDLVERAIRAVGSSGSLASALQSDLSRFSGNRDLDPQGDGYRERWTFQDGSLTSWVRDTLKDGEPELTAQFNEGGPSSLTVRTAGDTLLTLSYSTYPYVASVKETQGAMAGTRTYLLIPYSMRCSFLAPTAFPLRSGAAPQALGAPVPFSAKNAAQSSYRIEENGLDGTVIRRIDLLRGKKVFMEESTFGKGVFDHRVWYENGQPVRGARDPDGSGKFLVRETWRDGRLAGIAADTNGDGKVSYRERYVPSLMKSWDYNEDGIDDSREYPIGPDTVVRDFSSQMNGVFDVSYVWKSGNLVRVTRYGQTVAVTHDSARGVVWIGTAAPAETRVDVNGPEGYRMIGGKQYLVFRHEGVTYVEALP